MIVDAQLIDGAEAKTVIESMFANPEISYIHVHKHHSRVPAARASRFPEIAVVRL